MTAETFDQEEGARRWAATRQGTEIFGTMMGKTCEPEFRHLIVEEVAKLSALRAPRSPQEEKSAKAHAKLVEARIRSIAHASTSSMSSPAARQACLEIIQDICSRPPAGANSLAEAFEANSRIRTACWNTTMG